MEKIRRYFATGLLVTMPVFLTFYILFIIFKFVNTIPATMINSFLRNTFGFTIPGIGFILEILLIFAVGFITSNLLAKKILPVIEQWFLRLPVIRQIYPPIKQIVGFIFSKDKAAFKKVVLVEYPSKGIWSVGFMTNESFKEANEKTGEELIHVFIGSTPGPWSGFFILVPKGNIKFLDISVEDGMKLIVSGGIIKPS